MRRMNGSNLSCRNRAKVTLIRADFGGTEVKLIGIGSNVTVPFRMRSLPSGSSVTVCDSNRIDSKMATTGTDPWLTPPKVIANATVFPVWRSPLNPAWSRSNLVQRFPENKLGEDLSPNAGEAVMVVRIAQQKRTLRRLR